jgi:hypothetical protein
MIEGRPPPGTYLPGRDLERKVEDGISLFSIEEAINHGTERKLCSLAVTPQQAAPQWARSVNFRVNSK